MVVTDHLGNEFRSKNEMYRHYGITKGAARMRLELGWSLEDTLTKPISIEHHGEVYDHLGNKFESKREMCRYWNVSFSLYNARIKRGWSLKRTLEEDIKDWSATDHLGNVFSTQSEMCKFHGVSDTTFKKRIKEGMSLEEALTPDWPNRHKWIDHEGNAFESTAELCRYWNISYVTFNSRIIKGWSIEEAITKPYMEDRKPRSLNKWKILKLVFVSKGERYFLCSRYGQEEVLSISEIEEQ